MTLLRDLLLDANAVERAAVHPIYDFVERELPRDARILLLDTNQTFFLERDHLADSFFEASQIAADLAAARTVEDVERRLRERGVTHVVLDRRQRPRRLDLPVVLGQMLGARTVVLFRSEDGRFEVRELR